MSREPERDDWLGTTLRRSPAPPTDACLDAETLAAWADGGLTAQAAAAVELHVSDCSRCMAMLAAMERAAPVSSSRPAWTPARLFRWLVPLTAAAAAIAIWVVVPDRQVNPPQQSAAVQNSQAASPRADDALPQMEVQERRTLSQNPAPSTQNIEPQAEAKSDPQRDLQALVESRREKAAEESQGASAGASPAADAPPAAAPVPAAPSMAARSAAPESLAETVTARPLAFNSAVPNESIAPSNTLVRWRVFGPTSIERSSDGGKTWTSVTPLPGVAANNTSALSVVAVRAVDADRAVVETSDKREFYTTNGGRSWTPVQENSRAPF